MTHERQCGAMLQQVVDGGQRRADAGVIGNGARLVLRHIEVDAHQSFFALPCNVANSLFVHGNWDSSIKGRRVTRLPL
jgi:hypothetical protein